MSTVQIEIDGEKLEVQQGSMIIEAADEAGIRIPRFCYHKKLSVAANCRMCLIEVENGRKPMPACATPVTDGMKVFTKSPLAIASQKSVMEFLLINHPLDCPICDQGGQCELQDLAMGYGSDSSRYVEGKRSVSDKNIGPLISTELTRCIQCTRCVRFGTEIAGIRELGMTGRGEHSEIGTFIKHSVNSEMSGNVIDVCPVGALTAKPSRFTARAWEVSALESIAPHDCIGSNIAIHTRRSDVMSVAPRENESLNEVWISDRDRFSYKGLESSERVYKPQVKRNGVWTEVEWQDALNIVAARMHETVKEHGPEQLGALASPSCSVEELYLLQKLMRGLGSHNIDHRLRDIDFSDQYAAPLYPRFDGSIAELDDQNALLLIGSNIHKEVPIAAHRVRKAAVGGAAVSALSPLTFTYSFDVKQWVVPLTTWLNALALIVKHAAQKAAVTADASLVDIVNTAAGDQAKAERIASELLEAEKATITLGYYALTSPEAALFRALAFELARITKAKVLLLTEGSNSAGAWLSGAVPHRLVAGHVIGDAAGYHTQEMLEKKLKLYFLLNTEPSFACANSHAALDAVKNADFVVSLLPFKNHIMNEYVDVIFPIAPFSETSGTLINAAGDWQSFAAAVMPKGDVRPAWKVLRVLGNLLQIDGFDQESSTDVIAEVKRELMHAQADLSAAPWQMTENLKAFNYGNDGGLTFIPQLSLYSVDALVRRASDLQQTADAAKKQVYMSVATLERKGFIVGDSVKIKHGGISALHTVVVDDHVPDGSVLIPVGTAAAVDLAMPYRSVELIRD
ncbi:NADH dehydrogenase [Piscirickettsia salmonis]|uniref:NADH-quinone oxidoreductase n=1 Tax=Piscirickettsia salmonis TaxID=1238 RepID=A0A9Q6LVC7_PISSA|nr:NADH-quinone oxidoreductase subunit NuoG [Piscirickettsia salmonis]ALA23710.1 NADH dehydrogenase (quinone), G subunit [Piscirickettsia salmonis]APS44147.1 NADH dehydrogenase [Piscirickettsia salmonis]APS47508.1 NADH dehydrogenase [Piscirickettsia salmonis]APS51058.1 NADH dehydrogenase [Piscirickettsia salmonis]APS54265.1 NADH dehydrogenase [Piscirickettsia salmonis]